MTRPGTEAVAPGDAGGPMLQRRRLLAAATLSLGAAAVGTAAESRSVAAGLTVEAATKPGKAFLPRPTLTLADLPDLPADGPLDRFGGVGAGTERASGCFRLERMKGRWWLVDPDGGFFLAQGVNSITTTTTTAGRKALAARFGGEPAWARETTTQLRELGFNTAGAWSNHDALRAVDPPLVQTRLVGFMSAYGKKRGGTFMQAGHVGYPNDCPFIFDPEFPAFCTDHARQLADGRDDPWLLGHYSDNEMPWKRGLLERYLELPATDPGHVAARGWLDARPGRKAGVAVTDADRRDFLEFALDRYLSIVATAIRRHDPAHLFLGPRLHEIVFDLPEVYRACGRHCDVVSVNYYRAWTPDAAQMAMWAKESGRPFMVTEHYAKGVDSGLGNTSGAGWLVKTQQDRGRFYQNFALGLLRSRHCVGWFWHRYADNDPRDPKVDPSNRDSNKGLVTASYEPWTAMLDEMRPFNRRVHGLVAALDAGRVPTALREQEPRR